MHIIYYVILTRNWNVAKGNNLNDDNRNPTETIGDNNAKESQCQDGVFTFSSNKNRTCMLSVFFYYVKHSNVKHNDKQNLKH